MDTMKRLHDRLVTDAERTGLLDVAYRTLDSPVGALLLAATERGVVRIAYPTQDHDAVLADVATKISPRVLRAPHRLDAIATELDEYFAGARRSFDVPLDLQLAKGFRRLVLDELRHIDFGQTRSYGDVATAVGNPRAVRATGSACATNPLPIVVPCHRVVPKRQKLGRYVGGVEAKRALLELEAA